MTYRANTWILFLTLSLPLENRAATEPPKYFEDFEANPKSVYTFEDKGVRFTAKATEAYRKRHEAGWEVVVVELNEDGSPRKFLGAMTDDGFMGDHKRGDETYSRKIRFKPYKSRVVQFGLVEMRTEELKAKKTWKTAKPLVTTQLDFVRRPSFLEVLGKLRDKF